MILLLQKKKNILANRMCEDVLFLEYKDSEPYVQARNQSGILYSVIFVFYNPILKTLFTHFFCKSISVEPSIETFYNELKAAL